MIKNKGSFRDPAGAVYENHGRIYRLVSEFGRQHYELMTQDNLIEQAVAEGYLIPSRALPKEEWPFGSEGFAHVVEHDRIPYIAYPYEWSFEQLKDAALHHLDFQLFLLQRQVVLKDASAYNIQFIGTKPLFIDLLSLAPYKKGEYWLGHSQFCEQFLNPLLLRAVLGVTHHAWFRGRMEGIATADLARLIPFYKKLNWNKLTHIVLPARLEQAAFNHPGQVFAKTKSMKPLSKLAYEGILMQMRHWIASLKPKNTGKTVWSKYAYTHSYSQEELLKKRRFIVDFMGAVKPDMLVDLGCNHGDYALLALEHGAQYVLGFDFDPIVLDLAYQRAKKAQKPFLPLYLDAANPSPNQGWWQVERAGFIERTQARALLALAFIHHLAIAKNIPLSPLLDWLIAIAPCGVIEFIPKADPMVMNMLALREDIFSDYTQETFEELLIMKAKIIKKQCISEVGRILYWYERLESS